MKLRKTEAGNKQRDLWSAYRRRRDWYHAERRRGGLGWWRGGGFAQGFSAFSRERRTSGRERVGEIFAIWPFAKNLPLWKGKKSTSSTTYEGWKATPLIYQNGFLTSELSKIGQITPKAVLKNHTKSQKNHKMENSIMLDSKWVYLHNEYIIWYI
jgi:hypothetical protein